MWSVWTEVRRTRTAVRNCCLFEWLFTRTVYGLLDSLSWDEGEFWGKGWKRGWLTIFLLSSKRWSGFNLESVSEHPISQSGQWWGKGSRKRLEGTEVEQQMVMDGDQVHFLPLWEVSRCCIGTGCNHGPVCGLRGGGSVVRSALFAPGAAMFTTTGPQQCLQCHLHKCLEVIASLPSAVLRGDETQTDTFTGDTAITASHFQTQRRPYGVPNHRWPIPVCHILDTVASVYRFDSPGFRITRRQSVGSFKCLPPCFLLSSPFWSPFFGCSLGLWGCCGMKSKQIKWSNKKCTDWGENEDFWTSIVMILLPW